MKRFILALGILLLIAGLVGLIHPDFHFQKKEEVARLGPVQATVEKDETASVPMGISILLLVAGIGLSAFGVRSRK
ncbi:MAG TPA: hypothetical protein VLV88_02235 [Terriglobales bacterium]|nr:hypothetical protein [Terriglobales bacterium]